MAKLCHVSFKRTQTTALCFGWTIRDRLRAKSEVFSVWETLILRVSTRALVLQYLADGAAVGEARLGQPDDVSWRGVAHDVQVVLQGCVLGALEVHELSGLVHPDLNEGGREGDDRMRT